MTLSEKDTVKLRALKDNLPYFSKNILKIKTKDAKIVPFEFNQSQVYFHNQLEKQRRETGKVRMLVVKGRQSGISTYVAGRYYQRTSTNKALGTFILSHESGTTDKLFKMVKLFNERSPIAPAVKRSNARELDFENLNSVYYVGTAGSGEVGRGGTIQLFHGSEVAMWKNTDDIQTGLMESIPNLPGTEIILESTAKGMGNYFHRMVMDALAKKNEYRVAFLPWFWMDEYEESTEGFAPTKEEKEYADLYLHEYSEERQLRKLAWRRVKIANFGSDWKFKQEYPSTITEAFQTSGDTLIKPERVVKARNAQKIVGNMSPLVIGVDPARTGDRTAFCFRRGREIEKIVHYKSKGDDMDTVARIARYIEEHKPASVNIDCTNSYAIYDRLKELGHKEARAVHFSSKASEDRLYRNKRTEMWCKLRDWFDDEVCMPDDDEIHADFLAVPDYKETSDGLISLVSKDKIKEEFGMSPDLGDAAALTFAFPVSSQLTRANIKNANTGLKTTQRFKKR